MPSEEFLNLFKTDDSWKAIEELVATVMKLPDDTLTPETAKSIEGAINGALTEEMLNAGATTIIQQYDNLHYTKAQVHNNIAALADDINDYIDTLQPSETKRKLVNACFSPLTKMSELVLNSYHAPDFILPMTISANGHEPTYAHTTDAAADIYAAADMTLAPHSLSNVIPTGLRIALPEKWAAYILPRSSIGMKTGLRLSNSIGVIDSGYRGEIGVMYDNHADTEYVIHKGDRIAQMIVLPTFQFTANPVDILDQTDRNDGGFGSTGK